jgi:hypothetical protein
MNTKLEKIDWGNVITYNPTFGFDLFGDLPQEGIKVPAYGFYGGPQNTRPTPPGEETKNLFAGRTACGRMVWIQRLGCTEGEYPVGIVERRSYGGQP